MTTEQILKSLPTSLPHVDNFKTLYLHLVRLPEEWVCYYAEKADDGYSHPNLIGRGRLLESSLGDLLFNFNEWKVKT